MKCEEFYQESNGIPGEEVSCFECGDAYFKVEHCSSYDSTPGTLVQRFFGLSLPLRGSTFVGRGLENL